MTSYQRQATEIVKTLQGRGFTAYFAGGAVRDMLLGHEPEDIDVATSAKPEEIAKIFPHHIPTGKQFGVLRVKPGQHYFEVATFRVEGPYLDGRRPSSVAFTSDKEDAQRRDFTINGLFYDPLKKKVIDYVGGELDLKNKLLRFIGPPEERIREDHLRLLRAVRFKNRFHLEYDAATWAAVTKHAGHITRISPERVRDELDKMFRPASRSAALQDLLESGLLQYVLPEIAVTVGVIQPPEFHAEGDVFTHIKRALDILPGDAPSIVIWTTLLHDVGKPDTLQTPAKDQTDRVRFNHHAEVGAKMSRAILTRLRFPKSFVNEVVWMVDNHMRVWQLPQMRLAKQRALLMDPRFPHLLEVYKADCLGKRPGNWGDYAKILKLYEAEKARPREEKQAAILSGHDIIKSLKLSPGPTIQRLKETAQEAYLEGKVKTKKEALAFLQRLRNP